MLCSTPQGVQLPKSKRALQAHWALVKRGTGEADGARGRGKWACLQCEVHLLYTPPLTLVSLGPTRWRLLPVLLEIHQGRWDRLVPQFL
ncbi:hypothetical protein V8B97DRAFT_1981343 [Scleroderma yunnanense]